MKVINMFEWKKANPDKLGQWALTVKETRVSRKRRKAAAARKRSNDAVVAGIKSEIKGGAHA